MAGVTLNASFSMDASVSGAAGIASPRAGTAVRKSFSMAPGTATVDQADLEYAATRVLANSATENLDLAGVLTSPIGTTIAAAEVVAMYFEVTAGQLIIGAAASNGFFGPLNAAGTITLNAGEWIPMFSRSGWPVTATTGDLLKVTAGAAGATYNVVIVARSVAR